MNGNSNGNGMLMQDHAAEQLMTMSPMAMTMPSHAGAISGPISDMSMSCGTVRCLSHQFDSQFESYYDGHSLTHNESQGMFLQEPVPQPEPIVPVMPPQPMSDMTAPGCSSQSRTQGFHQVNEFTPFSAGGRCASLPTLPAAEKDIKAKATTTTVDETKDSKQQDVNDVFARPDGAFELCIKNSFLEYRAVDSAVRSQSSPPGLCSRGQSKEACECQGSASTPKPDSMQAQPQPEPLRAKSAPLPLQAPDSDQHESELVASLGSVTLRPGVLMSWKKYTGPTTPKGPFTPKGPSTPKGHLSSSPQAAKELIRI